jgi:integrase
MLQNFFNEIKANFNLRDCKSNKPTNIYMIVIINGKKYHLPTGVKVYPDQWNKAKQEAYISHRLTEMDNLNNEIVNKKILELNDTFSEYKHYICSNPNELTNYHNVLIKYMYKDMTIRKHNNNEEDAIKWYNKHINDSNEYSHTTKEVYYTQIKLFSKWLKEVKKISKLSFDMIDKNLIKEYEIYISKTKIKGNKLPEKVTIKNKMLQLLAVIKTAGECVPQKLDLSKSGINEYKLPKAKINEDEITLNEDEIKRIYDLDLRAETLWGDTKQHFDKEKRAYNLSSARDLFVLQCWVGQRYEDMQELNNAIFKSIKGEAGKEIEVIEIEQLKTKEDIYIPILPIVREILEKYKVEKGYKLPNISNKTMNLLVKELGEMAGIDEQIIYKSKKCKKYEKIGTHTARRSYVTNMLRRGINTEFIKRITGHKGNAAFERYNKLTNEDAVKTITKELSKKDSSVKDVKDIAAILKSLDEDRSNGINIMNFPNVSYLIQIIKSENDINVDVLKQYNDLIFDIAKSKIDIELYQKYQMRIGEKVLSYDMINGIFQQIANEDEDEHYNTFNQIK